jgi:hypothetical protein
MMIKKFHRPKKHSTHGRRHAFIKKVISVTNISPFFIDRSAVSWTHHKSAIVIGEWAVKANNSKSRMMICGTDQ